MTPAKPTGRRATLKDVAAEVGVSPATVSNAYNRPDQLSPGLRERIMQAAQALGYSGPDPLARSLRRGQVGALGVVYAARLSYAFADPAAALFLQGLSGATEDAGLNLLLLPAPDSPEAIFSAGVDGFVVYCLAESSRSLQAILTRDLPCVMVDQLRGHGRPMVSIDDRAGAREAARHLLDLGHRRLGVLSLTLGVEGDTGGVTPQREQGAQYKPPAERLRGYREAVEAAGLDWESAVTILEVQDNTPEEGEALTRQLLSRAERPTALLAMSDQLALGALRGAAALGLQVPAEVSIIGYDDVPAARLAQLTTVHQPTVQKGRLAGELMLAQLSGEPPEPPASLPTHLVVRGTTAAPAVQDERAGRSH